MKTSYKPKSLNLDINEEKLERSLFIIGNDRDDWSMYCFEHVKKSIRNGKYPEQKINSVNPLVEQHYCMVEGEPRIYPVFNPSSKLGVEIIKYEPIFNGETAIILAKHNKQDFYYFDHNFSYREYKEILSINKKIKLAAIARATSTNDNLELDIKELGISNFHEFEFPIYSSVLEVISLEKRHNNFSIYKVKNPLNKNSELELVVETSCFNENINTKLICADFYFIGTLK